jgi:hypothetical protein
LVATAGVAVCRAMTWRWQASLTHRHRASRNPPMHRRPSFLLQCSIFMMMIFLLF